MNFYFIFLCKLHLNLSKVEALSTSSWRDEKQIFEKKKSSFLCFYGNSLLEWDSVSAVDLQEAAPDSREALLPHVADLTPECSLLPKPGAMVLTWARCYRRNKTPRSRRTLPLTVSTHFPVWSALSDEMFCLCFIVCKLPSLDPFPRLLPCAFSVFKRSVGNSLLEILDNLLLVAIVLCCYYLFFLPPWINCLRTVSTNLADLSSAVISVFAFSVTDSW